MQLINSTKKARIVKLDLFILAILGVAIVLSFFLVGGLMPEDFKPTQYSDTQFYTPSNLTSTPSAERGLQLDLIKLKSCSSTTAVNFLVDRSGSMRGTKLAQLKNGLLAFKNKLSDENIFGLQTYSYPPNTWINVVNPTYVKDVKSDLRAKICSIQADGWTHSKDAFLQTESILYGAKNKYPGYNFVLIFISDGVPETDEESRTCGQSRCFATKQDPTEVAKRIKENGIRIITLAYTDSGDQGLNEQLQAMMQRVASSPEDYYKAPSSNEVKEILEKIVNSICKEVE